MIFPTLPYFTFTMYLLCVYFTIFKIYVYIIFPYLSPHLPCRQMCHHKQINKHRRVVMSEKHQIHPSKLNILKTQTWILEFFTNSQIPVKRRFNSKLSHISRPIRAADCCERGTDRGIRTRTPYVTAWLQTRAAHPLGYTCWSSEGFR